MESIIEQFSQILQKKAPCQKSLEDDDSHGMVHFPLLFGWLTPCADESNGEDAEEEEEDDDSRFLELLDTVTECLVDLAHALGALFAPFMDILFPHLLTLARDTAHHSIRATAYGAMAEVIKGAASLPSPSIASQLFQFGISGMNNKQQDIQRTAAFLSGVMLQLGGSSTEAYVPQILLALSALFNSKSAVVVDNACGAVARIITTFPSSPYVPLDRILPIFLPALPLKDDRQEDEPVWSCILALSKSPQITSTKEGVVQLFIVMARGLLQEPPMEQTIYNEVAAVVRAWLPQLQAIATSSAFAFISATDFVSLLQVVANKLGVP